jgi:uncharacterized protein (DUF1015 family)
MGADVAPETPSFRRVIIEGFMATLIPFRALRPRPVDAARIAAVPYDVVNTDEARALADGNPLSFLRVSRAEIELPPTVDPYSDEVYRRAAENFAKLKACAYELEAEPSLYVYRLRMGSHQQTGLGACFALAEYDRSVIKKHERTRRDKEDDRTRHMIALGAQTGPVFLIYRSSADVNAVSARAAKHDPLIDFEATDRVRHTLWRVAGSDCHELVRAFQQIPALYIADGHHRAASAARARAEIGAEHVGRASLGDGADVNSVLAVAFPHDQMQVLAYNRLARDLAGLSPEAFLAKVGEAFSIEPGPAMPATRGEIAMYLGGQWRTLRPRVAPSAADATAALDVSVLQNGLLDPVLGIVDVRTDKRIDFVGGVRGTDELQQAVDSGRAAVGFSLYPVSIADLMTVSDAGKIMPPKSTWFEPKLRDGLLIHMI